MIDPSEDIKFFHGFVDNHNEAIKHLECRFPNIKQCFFDGKCTLYEVCKCLKLYSTQKSSIQMQKLMCEYLNATPYTNRDSKGDFKIKANNIECNMEYKITGLSNNNKLNVRQIRKTEQCHYMIQYIDEDRKLVNTYILTNSQMNEEIKLHNEQPTHGKKGVKNKNNEYSITANKDTLKRWNEKYKIDENEINVLSIIQKLGIK